MFQPYTTDQTVAGLLRARNTMRLRLWADDAFAHRWLCHPERGCADGCAASAVPSRLALYESELEAPPTVALTDAPTATPQLTEAQLARGRELKHLLWTLARADAWGAGDDLRLARDLDDLAALALAERLPDSRAGATYRITTAGRAALEQP